MKAATLLAFFLKAPCTGAGIFIAPFERRFLWRASSKPFDSRILVLDKV